MNNTLLPVLFPEGELHVWHKTGMGSLTDLLNIGNKMRASSGKTQVNIAHFLARKGTIEFIEIIKRREGKSHSEVLLKTGKGKAARTYGDLALLIYMAEYMDAEFHYDVIKVFIRDRLLEWRDSSGEEFKALNNNIDLLLPERDGKDNRGIYMQTAILMKNKINPDGGTWNTATAQQLRDRSRLESKISDYLIMGFVKNWNHLKELINKL